MPWSRSFVALLSALLASWAGGCDEPAQPAPVSYDANRARRLFEPPEGEVRAVPPHAIHAQGVGPYRLGASLHEVLGLSSRGPRVTLIRLDGVADYSLVQAEDALLVGVDDLNEVGFVSVLDEEIARTDSGVGVGSELSALHEALGPALRAPDLAMHPRLVALEALPDVRFLLDPTRTRVAAVVVRRGPDRARALAPGAGSDAAGDLDQGGDAGAGATCAAGPDIPVEDLRRAAELPADVAVVAASACLAGEVSENLLFGDGKLVVLAGEPDKLRRLAVHAAPGARFAAPVDVDGDGRSEVAVVLESERPEARVVSLEVLRLDGGRFTRLAEREVYRLSAQSATWVGARLDEIELLVELHGGSQRLQVSGLYVHRGGQRLEAVAPLLPVTMAVDTRRRRGAPGLGGLLGDAGLNGRDAGLQGAGGDRGAAPDAAPRSGVGGASRADDNARRGSLPASAPAPSGTPRRARDAGPRR
ncbi:hypothetical protein [Haliangium sp.]|uniref:hypothetical protein n=1 Tax=Haliangium sp. TaxID=2663208 RepID=UPI003D0EBE37